MPPADALQGGVAEGLRVDADTGDAELPQELQLFGGEYVRPPRLDGVFDAALRKGRQGFQHPPQLRGLQHQRGAPADVHAFQAPVQAAAGGDLAPERFQIPFHILPRAGDVGGDEGAVIALGGAERDADVEVGRPLFPPVDALLRPQDGAHESDVLFADAEGAEHGGKISAGGLFGVGELGGTDARQRTPGHGDARQLAQGKVDGELGKALGVALALQLALPRLLVLIGKDPPAGANFVQKQAAFQAEGVLDVGRGGEQPHHVHQFGV